MRRIIQIVATVLLLTFALYYISVQKVNINPMNVSPNISPCLVPQLENKPTPQIITGLNYANSTDKEQELDLYLPAAKDFPTVVFVHGGAWNTGTKEMYAGVGTYLQARGIACAVINYRLSPRVIMPTHAYDTAKAFSYTKNRIGSFGGNGKIFLIGHSAGGHLVSLIATDNKYLASVGASATDISGVITISGIYLINYNVNIFGSGSVFRGTDKADLSPINHIRSKMPPFLIFYADKDIPTLDRQAKNFYKAYARAGNIGKLCLYGGNDHTSILVNMFTPVNAYEEEVISFLKK